MLQISAVNQYLMLDGNKTQFGNTVNRASFVTLPIIDNLSRFYRIHKSTLSSQITKSLKLKSKSSSFLMTWWLFDTWRLSKLAFCRRCRGLSIDEVERQKRQKVQVYLPPPSSHAPSSPSSPWASTWIPGGRLGAAPGKQRTSWAHLGRRRLNLEPAPWTWFLDLNLGPCTMYIGPESWTWILNLDLGPESWTWILDLHLGPCTLGLANLIQDTPAKPNAVKKIRRTSWQEKIYFASKTHMGVYWLATWTMSVLSRSRQAVSIVHQR